MLAVPLNLERCRAAGRMSSAAGIGRTFSSPRHRKGELERESESHGHSPGPVVVESSAAAGRPDPCRPVRSLFAPGRSHQCTRAGARDDARDEELKARAHERAAEGQAGGFAQQPAGRGVRPGPRGRQADDRPAPFRRPDRGRDRDPQPCIAELETGEGKTLVATMPTFLNALPGKGVHVVTVNDYLARRDAEWMAPIYKHARPDGRLHPDRPDRRRRAAPPTPATSPTGPAKELGFDFLRDELKRLQAGRRRPPQDASSRSSWAAASTLETRDARAADPLLRDRRRGRQHPDRRGADPADHRGQQPADPGRGRGLLRRRPARRHAGPRQGLQVRPAGAQGRADRRRPAQGPGRRGAIRRSSP